MDVPHADAGLSQYPELPGLINRIRNGDERALAEIMKLMAPRLYRIAWAITRSQAISEEALQDVFFVLWQRRSTLDSKGNVSGYLYRAVRNQVLMALRKERTRERITSSSGAELGQSALEQSHIQPPGSEGLFDNDEQRREQVYRALDTLPEQMKEVYMLRWAGELAPPEIAETLGIAVRTVYNQLHRATRRIQELVGTQ